MQAVLNVNTHEWCTNGAKKDRDRVEKNEEQERESERNEKYNNTQHTVLQRINAAKK